MAAGQPNIVLIISDDMGYSDLPKFGRSSIPTPSLDRLADTGALFREAYVTAPICSPSRMALITGQHHQRFGHYDIYNLGLVEPEAWRRFMEVSNIAEVLGPAGYACGAVGKWHMGHIEEPLGCHPMQRGFEHFVGIPKGMSDYRPGAKLYNGYDAFEAPEYLTDYFGAQACQWIRDHADGPFLLHLAFNAVHAPLQAVSEDLAAVGEFPSPDRKTYAAMLKGMDRNIGAVMDTLGELGIAENTIVAFVNDNGGGGNHTPKHTRNTGRNAPLRGFKFDLYEGGIRVPMLLSWPKEIPGGQVVDAMTSSMDLFPTFLAAAGVDAPDQPCDGTSLLPVLTGQTDQAPHDVLCWRNRTWAGSTYHQHPLGGVYNSAIRRGPWKMVRRLENTRPEPPEPCHVYDNPWELYDLREDIGEQHDLAAEHPERVNDLADEFATWHDQMAEPVFM